MALAIARECKWAKAILHAYVVMPHHIHLVVTLHENMNVQQFMKILKRESSRSVRTLLAEEELARFSQQTGLNRNTFWQRSFRSIEIIGEKMFWSKVDYVHWNPVRAGLAERPEEYVCSSARLYEEGRWSEDVGLADAVAQSLRTGVTRLCKTEMCES